MEAEVSSETSVNIYHTTGRHIVEDSDLYGHRHENLKSKIFSFSYDTESWM
jgi:hypothetical protein